MKQSRAISASAQCDVHLSTPHRRQALIIVPICLSPRLGVLIPVITLWYAEHHLELRMIFQSQQHHAPSAMQTIQLRQRQLPGHPSFKIILVLDALRVDLASRKHVSEKSLVRWSCVYTQCIFNSLLARELGMTSQYTIDWDHREWWGDHTHSSLR